MGKLKVVMPEKAEKPNGWAAMLGFVLALSSSKAIGQIIPGIF